jgi:ATP-binding cassette, subfamily B (MDR/TAP), member 1
VLLPRPSLPAYLTVGSHTRELQTATSQTLGFLVCDVFVLASCMVVAFVFSYKLTLVMVATAVPSALILWFINRFLDPAIESQRQDLAESSKHAHAAMTAIDLVKVYDGEDHEAFQYMRSIRRSARHYMRQVLCNCGQMGYIKLWMIMLFVVGFYVAIVFSQQGSLSPGNAVTAFYAVLTAFQPLEALGPQWLILAKGMTAAQSLHGFVSDPEDGCEMQSSPGCHPPTACVGNIEIRNVSFVVILQSSVSKTMTC